MGQIFKVAQLLVLFDMERGIVYMALLGKSTEIPNTTYLHTFYLVHNGQLGWLHKLAALICSRIGHLQPFVCAMNLPSIHVNCHGSPQDCDVLAPAFNWFANGSF